MTHSLNLELLRAEGALVRVLGLTERRGFQPLSLSAGPGERTDTWSLALTVHADRPVELLCRQLERLFDVLEVRLCEEAAPRLEVAR